VGGVQQFQGCENQGDPPISLWTGALYKLRTFLFSPSDVVKVNKKKIVVFIKKRRRRGRVCRQGKAKHGKALTLGTKAHQVSGEFSQGEVKGIYIF